MTDPRVDQPGFENGAAGSLCVLASGSKGNCSVLVVPATRETARRVILIDAGLSPSRTRLMLHQRGIRPDEVDEIVFTHLDSDHCHPGWINALRSGSRTGAWRAQLRVHRMHMGRARRMGLLYAPTDPFDEVFSPARGVEMRVMMLAHDDLGVAVFRTHIALPDRAIATMGFATDLGHVNPGLIEHLRGVDTLAIESNYCPVMQENSGRPIYLQRRIMGGAGHLSNEQSAMAVSRIGPRRNLVLLHLSQECNEPAIAMGHHRRFVHEHAGRRCVISSQFEPTPWVDIVGDGSSGSVIALKKHTQPGLFSGGGSR
ncbi:MAG: MBL fold metallo-hydrolase [Phycisphaerales bacterium]